MHTVTTIKVEGKEIQWVEPDRNYQKMKITDFLLYQGDDYIRGLEFDGLLESAISLPLSSGQMKLLLELWGEASVCWVTSEVEVDLFHEAMNAEKILKERGKAIDDLETWPLTPLGERVSPYEYVQMMDNVDLPIQERFRTVKAQTVFKEYELSIKKKSEAEKRFNDLVEQVVDSFQSVGFPVLWIMLHTAGEVWASVSCDMQEEYEGNDVEKADW